VLKVDVIAGKPEMLTSAIGLARLYEAWHSAITRSNQAEERKLDIGNQQTSNPPFLPIKRLTPEGLKERQAKGLCFKCNDKYVPGHRCKKIVHNWSLPRGRWKWRHGRSNENAIFLFFPWGQGKWLEGGNDLIIIDYIYSHE
jgi:hypothetical protein